MKPNVISDLQDWPAISRYLRDRGPGWLFRGHADAAWDLRSTLERYCGSLPPSATEAIVTRRFERNAHAYLDAHHMPTDALEWMALMQHHGAPTRLLDWTTSPYVAAFFALEEAVDPKSTCAIWAVDATWCREQGTTVIRRKGADHPRLRAFESSLSTWDETEFEEIFRKRKLRVAMPVEPYRRNDRLTIQNGTFLCPGDVDAGFAGNFADYDLTVIERHVVKIEFPALLRREVLQDLNAMNVNRATLFPGLDGFAQSLKHATVLIHSQDQLAQWIKRRAATDLP